MTLETTAICVHKTGGAEVMRTEKIRLPPPAAGEVLIRTRAAGVNFIDVYHRTGLYPLPLPFVLGMEGAGVVEAVGERRLRHCARCEGGLLCRRSRGLCRLSVAKCGCCYCVAR